MSILQKQHEGAIEQFTKTISVMSTKMGNMQRNIATLGPSSSRQNISRSSRNYRNRSISRSWRNLCWYHERLDKKENQCNQPCSFVSENEQAVVDDG